MLLVSRSKFTIAFLAAIFALSAQRVEVIDVSLYRHNYVVGDVAYIEVPADTARLKYIASLRISGKQDWTLLAAQWHHLFKLKATELGANAMRCSRYVEDSTSVAIDVRVYFGPERFLDDNKDRALMNELVVFNQGRLPRDSGDFYLNSKHIRFDPSSYYAQPLSMKEQYLLKNNSSDFTARRIQFNRTRKAEFYVVRLNKNSVTFQTMNFQGQTFAVSIAGVPVTFGRNAAIPVSYEVGRFMMDVYRIN